MVAPTGKQNSFGSRAWAYYVLAEKGDRQPRSLSLAFARPVREGDMLNSAIAALTTMRENLDKVCYETAERRKSCGIRPGQPAARHAAIHVLRKSPIGCGSFFFLETIGTAAAF